MIKICVTTSDAYIHVLPIFIFLFKKYWPNQEVEIVGYTPPPKHYLPEGFTFYSMGKQEGGSKNFSNDLRKYFEQQDQHFIWLMEDTFIREPVDLLVLKAAVKLTERKEIGRINLCAQGRNDFTINIEPVILKGPTNAPVDLLLDIFGIKTGEIYAERQMLVFASPSLHPHRLSTLPAIWNKDYLIRYLTADLNPWEFETQPKVLDEFQNVCLEYNAMFHNEGVRKHDIYKFNLEGIDEDVINEMKELGIL